MKTITKILGTLAAAGSAVPAFAQEAAEAVAAVPNPGNNAWMMTATILVLLMILPGLALFYGGLTRTKNMLSTMTQIGAAACLAMLIWVMYGYGLAFGPEGNALVWIVPARLRLSLTKLSRNMSLSLSR